MNSHLRMSHSTATAMAATKIIPVVLLCIVATAHADFYYPHFNDTAALRFNGDSATTSCEDGGPYTYDPVHGKNDDSDYGEALGSIVDEKTGGLEEFTVATVSDAQVTNTTRFEAVYPHREEVSRAPDRCNVRLRLTPARPYKASSIMRVQQVPVLDGFESGFTFQVTDHARACTLVKDQGFGPLSHKSCSVHGGDGLALVIHADPIGSGALGSGGQGIGYAGLRRALVIELDTWYNANPVASGSASAMTETDDAAEDHIAVQASPSNGDEGVSATASTRLGHLVRAPLADGALHTIRVVYWPHLRYDLLHAFSASTALLPLLVDGGEGRAVGTLAVYLDDGGGWGSSFNTTTPLLAIPLNLGVVLRTPNDRAWIGFTSSTGRAWEKHDVLSWYFCEAAGCPTLRGVVDKLIQYYDSTDGVGPMPADELATNAQLDAEQAGEVLKYGPAAVQ